MNISLWVAFLGGLISLATPCSAMVLPTFSAAAAGKKRHLFKMSLLFSIGLLAVLIPIGLGFVTIGQLLQEYQRSVTLIIGITLLLLAVITLFGRHPNVNLIQKILPQNRLTGISAIFGLGLVAGMSTTACMGPVFGAIVAATATSSPLFGVIHVLAYGFGILLPLVVFSVGFDRWGGRLLKTIRTRTYRLGQRELLLTDLLSAGLLLIFAYIFIIEHGMITSSINPLTERLLDLQDQFLERR